MVTSWQSSTWLGVLGFITLAALVVFYLDGSHQISCSSDITGLRHEIRYLQQTTHNLTQGLAVDCSGTVNASVSNVTERLREQLAAATQDCETRLGAVQSACSTASSSLTDCNQRLVTATAETKECHSKLAATQNPAPCPAPAPCPTCAPPSPPCPPPSPSSPGAYTGHATNAMCFSGFLRSFIHHKDNLYNRVAKPSDAEAFMHLYVGSEGDITIIEEQVKKLPWVKAVRYEYYNDTTRDEIWRWNWRQPPRDPSNPWAESQMSMFRKIALCQQLLNDYEFEHQFHYEYIMRLRTDLEFHVDINIRDCARNICIPHYPHPVTAPNEDDEQTTRWHPKDDPKTVIGVNDQMAWGPRHLMQVYSYMYYVLDFIPAKDRNIIAEHALWTSLEQLNVAQYVKRLTNVPFYLYRGR